MTVANDSILATGNTGAEDGIIIRSLTSITNERVTIIGKNAFEFCDRLTTASFPNVTSISAYAF